MSVQHGPKVALARDESQGDDEKEEPPVLLRNNRAVCLQIQWAGRLDLNQRPPEPHSRQQ